jgi:hypothetical protein
MGSSVPNRGTRRCVKYGLLACAQLLAALVFVLLSRAESGRPSGARVVSGGRNQRGHDPGPAMPLADVEAADRPHGDFVDASSPEGSIQTRNNLSRSDTTPPHSQLVARRQQPGRRTGLHDSPHGGAIGGRGAVAVIDTHRRNAPAPPRRSALIEQIGERWPVRRGQRFDHQL